MDVSQITLFKDLEFRDEVNLCATTMSFKKGETLFCGNQLAKYFYIIISGTIKCYQLNLINTKEQTIFVFGKGDMFDVVTLLDKEPHDVVYEALQECELLQFPIQKIREWIETKPEFNKKFSHI